MLPITGPTEVVKLSSGFNRINQTRYVQAKPYNLPLPFRYRSHFVLRESDWAWPSQLWNVSTSVATFTPFSYDGFLSGTPGAIINRIRTSVKNRALARFNQKMGDQAQLLTSLFEVNSTMAMITNRVKQLGAFAKAVARADIPLALRTVRDASGYTDYTREHRRKKGIREIRSLPASHWKSKSVGSAFLETWFGWLPTIGDIQSGLSFLGNSDLGTRKLFATAREPFFEVLTHNDQIGTHEGYAFCRIGAEFSVTNSDAFLISQLGLSNPLLTAYELIPYSWMANWFVNLDQFLQQFSIYPGTSVGNPWYSEGIYDLCDGIWPVPGFNNQRGITKSFNVVRTVGSLPSVSLAWRFPNRLSFTRGATLASLLIVKNL